MFFFFQNKITNYLNNYRPFILNGDDDDNKDVSFFTEKYLTHKNVKNFFSFSRGS